MSSEISKKSIFEFYMIIFKTSIDVLEENYHSDEANDIKSYQVIILKRIYTSMSTLEVMLSQCQDPISSYGLLRVIVDSICAYCFIYDNDDKVEVEFRHYLYMLDGCANFTELCKILDNDYSNSNIENSQYIIESKHSQGVMQNLQNGIIKRLCNHYYMSRYPTYAYSIIKKKEWKYKSINSDINKNNYDWRELYEKVGCDTKMSNYILKYLSQYVHGLFLSNTINTNQTIHYSIIYETLLTMIKNLIRVIFKIFKEDNICNKTISKIDIDKFANNETIYNGELLNYILKGTQQQ